MLGERQVRRWERLVAAVGAGQEKTSDLVLVALVRGRFGELMPPPGPAWRIGPVFARPALSD
jgi:hypothetical protein